MPELRKDPIVGRWVIIATERGQRPVLLSMNRWPRGSLCPFCEGHEVHTPHEILAYRERGTRPDERGWRVRVVPNNSRPCRSKAPSTSAARASTTR